MNQQDKGKDLPLTRYAIESASQQERLLYGEMFKRLFAESGIQQKELAERANVTARTIRNIEQGKVAAQAEKLVSLFIALGIELDGDPDADVRTYTRMLAPVIRRISPEHRSIAVADAVDTLTEHLFRHPNTHLAPVTPLRKLADAGEAGSLTPFDEIDDVGAVEYPGADRVAASEGTLAADEHPAVDEHPEPAPEDDL